MIETSSFLLWTTLAIFGYLRKMFGNVRLAFGQILENLRKSPHEDKINFISPRGHVTCPM